MKVSIDKFQVPVYENSVLNCFAKFYKRYNEMMVNQPKINDYKKIKLKLMK